MNMNKRVSGSKNDDLVGKIDITFPQALRQTVVSSAEFWLQSDEKKVAASPKYNTSRPAPTRSGRASTTSSIIKQQKAPDHPVNSQRANSNPGTSSYRLFFGMGKREDSLGNQQSEGNNMPIKKTVYACEHCDKKMYRDLSTTKKHENKCFWNPEHRACASCGNQDRESRVCYKVGAELNVAKNLRKDCQHWEPMPAVY
jgi:hypothetical protein